MTPTNDWRGDGAYIGKTVQIKGEISSEEDLAIEGEMTGTLRLTGQRLTIGPMGKIKAEVTAREVIVYGNLQGNVHAHDRVEIKKTGSVMGDLKVARISIEDGAYFKGNIDIQVRASQPVAATSNPGPAPKPAIPAATRI